MKPPKTPVEAHVCDQAVLNRLFDCKVVLLESPGAVVRNYIAEPGTRVE